MKETDKERHSEKWQHTETKRTVFCFNSSIHFRFQSMVGLRRQQVQEGSPDIHSNTLQLLLGEDVRRLERIHNPSRGSSRSPGLLLVGMGLKISRWSSPGSIIRCTNHLNKILLMLNSHSSTTSSTWSSSLYLWGLSTDFCCCCCCFHILLTVSSWGQSAPACTRWGKSAQQNRTTIFHYVKGKDVKYALRAQGVWQLRCIKDNVHYSWI